MMDGGSTPPPQRDPRTVLSQPYVIPTPIRRVSSQQHVPAAAAPADPEERKQHDPAAGTGLDPVAPASPKKPSRVNAAANANPPSGSVWSPPRSPLQRTLLTPQQMPALASLFISSPKPVSVTRQPCVSPPLRGAS